MTIARASPTLAPNPVTPAKASTCTAAAAAQMRFPPVRERGIGRVMHAKAVVVILFEIRTLRPL
jgi:hypothetical protein